VSEPAPSAPTAPSINPRWLERPALTCGDGSIFPPEALTGPIGAELGLDDAAAALREFLATEQAPEMAYPMSGWQRVSETGDAVLFVVQGAGDPAWHQIALTRQAGRWQLDRVGACAMTIAVPTGITIADWWIDPAEPPDATTTRVSAILVERACTGGKQATGRILPPIILYRNDSVVVAVAVTDLPGANDCPGNPPTPFEFDLTQPLGARRLLNGGVWPPAEPIAPG
jgi:hypothetical protein